MHEFVPGQRWINDAQLQMGLGTVLSTDFRTVTIIFMAAEETFVYAKESVPLTRVRFARGDQIMTADEQELEVVDVAEEGGLFVYSGKNNNNEVQTVREDALNNFIQLNRPSERLFNGQIDRSNWFEVRYQTQLLRTQVAQNPIRGLAGGRVSLIPHQLYIANEVANRYAPRVLLADEVGLGKTIEAGMILHHQLVTERARRVLIVVPESLVHQWLVEMLRRFNLQFKVFDAERMASYESEDHDEGQDDDLPSSLREQPENPFQSEQLVLCSLEFLCSRPDYYKQCRDGEWDLLVVDEAHHLEWSEQDPGFEYQLIEQLAQRIKGILLLTATPEQLGKSSHFARLHLLDPDRFPDFRQFEEEEERYEPVARAIDSLLVEGASVAAEALEIIRMQLGSNADEACAVLSEASSDEEAQNAAIDYLVRSLVDRHGTGRVLFRNTRSAVQGFPERIVHPYALPLPQEYSKAFKELEGAQLSELQLLLCPELLYQAISIDQSWTHVDTRVEALADILQQYRLDKILVIAASADTALDLAEWLRVSKGVHAAVFHEGMSLLERDRAAAFFADQISGTQILICSEIGSEGRNFQFSHHLVLFDLPLNPDLLEQRIGRLDRIGQTETIHLHVLYMQNTAQEIMFRWYEESLNAFSQTCPVGHAVFARVEDEVTAALHHPSKDYGEIISNSAEHARILSAALQQGRDRLLEFNSCRPEVALALSEQVQEQDHTDTLQHYMETVFDCFGIDHEIHSEECYAIHPGTHMTMPLTQLPDEGMTVTYKRDVALSYEDVNYLSWDHPLVTGAMDMVLAGELGNTSVIAVPIEGVARGTILLESIFILESVSNKALQSDRYLPATAIRVFIDQKGKRFDKLPSYRTIETPGERLKPDMMRKILGAKEPLLRKMLAASEKLAQRLSPDYLADAVNSSQRTLQTEIDRLEAMIEINPNVRAEELEFFQSQLKEVTQRLEQSQLRLDAMRVIIAT